MSYLFVWINNELCVWIDMSPCDCDNMKRSTKEVLLDFVLINNLH
jgi:hypothetical protein